MKRLSLLLYSVLRVTQRVRHYLLKELASLYILLKISNQTLYVWQITVMVNLLRRLNHQKSVRIWLSVHLLKIQVADLHLVEDIQQEEKTALNRQLTDYLHRVLEKRLVQQLVSTKISIRDYSLHQLQLPVHLRALYLQQMYMKRLDLSASLMPQRKDMTLFRQLS